MRNIVLMTITFITILSCKKDVPVPVPIDYYDQMHCKVDGMDYMPLCEPESNVFDCKAITFRYVREATFIELISYNERLKFGISFSHGRLKLGENILSYPYLGSFHNISNTEHCISYRSDSNKLNNITVISIDTINRMIEATFQFDAINDCGDTVRIRDGYLSSEY